MEDILASIRRIIADDQSRSLPTTSSSLRRTAAINVAVPGSVAPPAIYDLPPPIANGSAPTVIGADLSAAEAGIAAPTQAAAAPPTAPVVRASVGEVALPHLNPPVFPPDPAPTDDIASAGVAPILDLEAKHAVPPADEASAPIGDTTVDAPADATSVTEAAPAAPPEDLAAPIEALDREVVSVAPAIPEVAVDLPAAVEPDVPLDPAPVMSVRADPAPDEATEIHDLDWDAELQPLISPLVGASVENSFQALASSVFVQNSGMIDGMMREMLRPMLKTWLDDNLPTIVERLVRIEIERVARGGRA